MSAKLPIGVATAYKVAGGKCCCPATAAAACKAKSIEGEFTAMKEEKERPQGSCWARLVSLTQRTSTIATQAALPPHLRSGLAAEDAAASLLQAAGLQVLERNYKTPGRGGGEIDLIARDGDTLVFVEVRQRKNAAYGGAAASISQTKQARWRYAAQQYLLRFGNQPPDCRFDVVLQEGSAALEWIRGVM
jgi:putative endonuclease